MRVHTKHFGDLEIDESKIITFPEGLPGFEQVKQFTIIDDKEDSPFKWLQGVDNPQLALVMITPYYFRPDYEVDIADSEVAILEIQDSQDVVVYSIVVIPEDTSRMTANLKAPVLINMKNNRGKQVIMEKGNYSVKHYILEELQQWEGEK